MGNIAQRTTATNQQLAYARLARGSTTFGPSMVIRAFGAYAGVQTSGIEVVAGPGGTAFAWTEYGRPQELLRIALLGGSAAENPETAYSLDSDDFGKRYAIGPALALPGSGAAPVVAWATLDGPGGESETVTDGKVFAATRRANGTYGDPVLLSDPSVISSFPLAVATRTTSVVAWSSGSFLHHKLQYAVRVGSGRFGSARPLTVGYAERQLSLAATNGRAIAVWASRPARSGSRATGRGIAMAILRDGS